MQFNRVVSFGDSFTWGTDLDDCSEDRTGYSKKTWPALIAKYYNCRYQSLAMGGSSNLGILRWLLTSIDKKDISEQDFVIINWTWIDRCDIFDNSTQYVSKNLDHDYGWNTIRPDSQTEIASLYYKNFYSDLSSKFETLKNIIVAIDVLKLYNINYLMTCQDRLTIDVDFFNPEYINLLIARVQKTLFWFSNNGFYNWALSNNYAVGKTGHPLEEAHYAAFEYIKNELNL